MVTIEAYKKDILNKVANRIISYRKNRGSRCLKFRNSSFIATKIELNKLTNIIMTRRSVKGFCLRYKYTMNIKYVNKIKLITSDTIKVFSIIQAGHSRLAQNTNLS